MIISSSDHFYKVHDKLIVNSTHFSVFVINQETSLSQNLITQKTELQILLFQWFCKMLWAIKLLNYCKMYWQFVLIVKQKMSQMLICLMCTEVQSNSWIIVYFYKCYIMRTDKCTECLWVSEWKCQFFNDSDKNSIDI